MITKKTPKKQPLFVQTCCLTGLLMQRLQKHYMVAVISRLFNWEQRWWSIVSIILPPLFQDILAVTRLKFFSPHRSLKIPRCNHHASWEFSSPIFFRQIFSNWNLFFCFILHLGKTAHHQSVNPDLSCFFSAEFSAISHSLSEVSDCLFVMALLR